MQKRSRLMLMMGLWMAFTVGFALPAKACQESCVTIEVSGIRGTLVDREGRPIAGAKLIVRDAALTARGPEAWCLTRRGPIVKKTKTDKRGNFDLKGLRPGEYWVTYMDRENGESFLLDVKEVSSRNRFELMVDSYGGFCYLVDVERIATKPPGWPLPVK